MAAPGCKYALRHIVQGLLWLTMVNNVLTMCVNSLYLPDTIHTHIPNLAKCWIDLQMMITFWKIC